MSFSPDGTLLGAGSWDGTVILWDIGTARSIATLEGHGSVSSVSFSPDGTLLASGSSHDTDILLWEVETERRIASLEGHGSGVNAVSFSPDGRLLASGSWDETVILWDVAAREPIATLEGHWDGVNAVSFSPEGTLLASGSLDGTVILWDVLARKEIVGFGHTERVFSASLGGSLLAAGGDQGTVRLWDISEWTGPRLWGLDVVSGDGQLGSPGEALPNPLVVEVHDQYGDPLPDARVTFLVTAGDGRLSGRFMVEHATTDANGRAELSLTLGLNPGLNTVGVLVGGLELATFHAEGVGTTVAELEGDYRTWHLPSGATARLGKGAIGEGDRAVALSADGECLAVASAIGVWLYETGTSRAQALLPSASPVHSVSFSLDGILAAGLDNGQVELWDVETGERIGTLRHADWGNVTVVFSRDGTALASGSAEQVIKLWNVETRRQSGIWRPALGNEFYYDISVAFSPDGTRLVSGFPDGTVRLWDVPTQTEVAILEGHTDRVTSVSFSPDGTLLASAGGGGDRWVRLWDVAGETEVATLREWSGVRSVAFAPPDGGILASAGGERQDPTVRLWDVATGRPVAELDDHTGLVHSVTFSPDGATLASAAADGRVLLRDLESSNVVGVSGHASLSSMALSPDGAMVAAGHPDGTVWLWDVGTGAPIGFLEGRRGRVVSLSFSPDGDLLALAGRWQDKTIELWAVETRRRVGTLEGHGDQVTSVSFSPGDGTTLASGSWDGSIKLWDVGTQTEAATLEGHTGQIRSLSFSPDGGLLASAGGHEDTGPRLWAVETRDLVHALEGHESQINAVAFSRDGSILASGSPDGIRLWDVATRAQIATLESNSGHSMAFSPDGKSLVSGSWGSVQLWNLGTKRTTATLDGHASLVHTVAFSPDGARLASGSRDGTILLWDPKLLEPYAQSLTKVSGLEQEGTAGAALDQPFVVSVRDQDGQPFGGALVTFAVTTGGGTLSATAVTTDAQGRAETTLNLGSQPGPNRVEVTVAGLEPVAFTAVGLAVPRTVEKISGDEQQGSAGDALDESFVVEVRDQNGNRMSGVRVTFGVATGGGTLSVTRSTTNAQGRAATTLTLGSTPGANSVEVTVAGLEPVTFTATAKATPDFDGDGLTGLEDFFLFAEAFGGSDPRFDLDGSGTVDFADFFLFAEAFEQPARAKLVALARERIGLPEGPQLQPNAPNPFNSGTVISWFQLQPGPAHLEVFALTGQRVAVLHEGAKRDRVPPPPLGRARATRVAPWPAGSTSTGWSSAEGAWTRKLTLLQVRAGGAGLERRRGTSVAAAYPRP